MVKKKLNYKEVVTELENIIVKLENENIDVDELSKYVKEATELVAYCREKLRNTEEELDKNLK